ncbi:MAG: hypothetical protein HZY79_00965 [Rhodoblastus sp.]|nr:MAG: hypothetical protein HZY79_00965 [Rhodoblastus sp.]
MAVEEPPERADAEMMAARGQFLLLLYRRDVARLVRQRQDEIGLRLDAMRLALAALRPGLRAPMIAFQSASAHRAGGAYAKAFRGLPARQARRHRRHDTFAQIQRKRLAHARRPPRRHAG